VDKGLKPQRDEGPPVPPSPFKYPHLPLFPESGRARTPNSRLVMLVWAPSSLSYLIDSFIFTLLISSPKGFPSTIIKFFYDDSANGALVLV